MGLKPIDTLSRHLAGSVEGRPGCKSNSENDPRQKLAGGLQNDHQAADAYRSDLTQYSAVNQAPSHRCSDAPRQWSVHLGRPDPVAHAAEAAEIPLRHPCPGTNCGVARTSVRVDGAILTPPRDRIRWQQPGDLLDGSDQVGMSRWWLGTSPRAAGSSYPRTSLHAPERPGRRIGALILPGASIVDSSRIHGHGRTSEPAGE